MIVTTDTQIVEYLKSSGCFENISDLDIICQKESQYLLEECPYIVKIFTTPQGLSHESYAVFVRLQDSKFRSYIPYGDSWVALCCTEDSPQELGDIQIYYFSIYPQWLFNSSTEMFIDDNEQQPELLALGVIDDTFEEFTEGTFCIWGYHDDQPDDEPVALTHSEMLQKLQDLGFEIRYYPEQTEE